jgi:hypothetical protein
MTYLLFAHRFARPAPGVIGKAPDRAFGKGERA